MKTLILLGLFILFLVSVQFASGQTVDDILDKYIAARGGKDKLKAIKSIIIEGSRERMDTKTSIKIFKEQGKLSRTEFDMAGSTGFMLVTDKEVWNYYPKRMQEPQKMPEAAVVLSQPELDIPGPLVDYLLKGHKAILQGKEFAGNINCYKISLTQKTGRTINYWIDIDSYLLIQSSVMVDRMIGVRSDNNEQVVDSRTPTELFTFYKDYKLIDGIMFAHTIEVFNPTGESMNGGSTTFNKIEINKPIDPKMYHPE